MDRNSVLASIVCSCVLIALRASSAQACGGLECTPDQFVPHGGTVPANLPGIAWWSGSATVRLGEDAGWDQVKTTPADLTFDCTPEGGAMRVVAFDVELTKKPYPYLQPTAALSAGEQCTLKSKVVTCDLSNADPEYTLLSQPHDLSYLRGVATFDVGPAAPLPAALGRYVTTPAALEKIELSESSGCSTVSEVCVVRGAIELSDDARAWGDAFVYESLVDGAPWNARFSYPLPREYGGSYLGRGKELVFATRPGAQWPESQGVSTGKHTIVLRATLPGTDIKLETAPVEIDLDCYASAPPPADAGVDSEAPNDPEDAAVPNDAGDTEPKDAGDRPKPRRRTRDSSCSTALGEPTGLGGGGCATLALLAFGFAVRRRRDRYRA